MLREECARFGKNLAIINTAVAQKEQEEQTQATATTQPAINPWAALRGFIASTMEKKEEFVQLEAIRTAGAGRSMEVET